MPLLCTLANLLVLLFAAVAHVAASYSIPGRTLAVQSCLDLSKDAAAGSLVSASHLFCLSREPSSSLLLLLCVLVPGQFLISRLSRQGMLAFLLGRLVVVVRPVAQLCIPLVPKSAEPPVAKVDPLEAKDPTPLPPGTGPRGRHHMDVLV